MTQQDTAPATPRLNLDSFLCFAIYSAGHAFNQLYRPLLDAIGLTYPQYLVMVALWSRDDQTVKDLGKMLFLESSTLTPLIKRLEGAGYLTRSRDPVDERMVRVRLTAEGEALRDKALSIPSCVGEATGLSSAELVALTDQLASTRDAILKPR
ncbi:MarR family transcriptional regulator [Rhizobium sp. CG5]|uniref:MarR family winged helix-turn-helix transcriptional regulator n=1 Tax=Rhizobium sp. CG5 TaxID=2726076 RepID=UPI002033BCF5|nr:MarR family transcriptional regulator [Rhizobium sp. CG5]MCM2472860.1 MarR family transcriptional regulator [Rhizobium sp. CG5]